MLRNLANASSSLRRSAPHLFPRFLLRIPAATSTRSGSYVSLGNLKPAPGSHRPTTRIGRGIGSGKGGHTTGRGHKGAKARGTGNPYVGFEGGQTPLHKKLPKRGFFNFTSKKYAPLPIARLQKWLQASRIDSAQPITIRSVIHSNLVHGLSKLDGIKLIGKVASDLPLPPLVVHLSRFTESAAKAILDAGGEVKAVYHNRLGLRQEMFPDRFVGREVKQAKPTLRADIEYYTDPEKFGYLADQKEAFLKERGFDPESALHRRVLAKVARGRTEEEKSIVLS
ncbi:MAG: YmL10 [Tremellales sp. Tagirdzhanova-0007]|nr:MAG: YmL10 [Tremellales sp. Tagirdzhanova-0007]